MDTSREDVGIAIRSAFLSRGTKQRFSLFALVVLSVIFIFVETIENKPLNYLRSIIKDSIYRGSIIISAPAKTFGNFTSFLSKHINLYEDYNKLVDENKELKENAFEKDYLELENTQLRKLINEQTSSFSNLVSARVILDKQSLYLNSFIINIGLNKNIKNGMSVLHGKNFIGRIVDVNFFSSRVLLVTDLNSKIPIITQPSSYHAILSGKGSNQPTLDYLPEKHKIIEGDKVYTSGKEGIFSPGIPIGEVKIKDGSITVSLFSDLSQISFVNINLGNELNKK